MYVCVCHAVSDKTIRKLAYEQGIKEIREIRKVTALGSSCGKCIPIAKAILQDANLNPLYKEAG